MLKFGTGQIQVQFPFVGIRDTATLFTHKDSNRVGCLSNTLCRSMAQSQISGDIGIMRHRQDAACAHNLAAINDEGTIMQRAILEKNVLTQSRVDVGIDHITSSLIVGERYGLLDDDKRTRLALGHIHTGIHDRHDPLFLIFYLGFALKQFFEHLEASPGSQFGEKSLDLVLKQNHQDKQAYVNKLVHDGANEAHIHHLVHHHPSDHKRQHADKNVERAGILHGAVEVEQQCRYQQDVKQVRDAEK